MISPDRYFPLSLFADSGIAVALLSDAGRWLSVNRALCELLGQSREELLSANSPTPEIKQFVSDLAARAQSASASRHTATCSTSYRRPDAELLLLRITVSILLESDASATGTYMALVDDVTSFQAELQESARESDRQFRVLERELSLFMQQTMLGVIEWDAELLVREWNPAAQSIFGYSRAEALGHSSFELIIPPSAAAHVACINRQLIAGTGGVYSVNENVRKNGARITCEWFNTALTGEDGRVSGAISLVRDISEQRRAQLFMERQRALDAIMTKTLTRFATCTPEDVDGYVVLALQRFGRFRRGRSCPHHYAFRRPYQLYGDPRVVRGRRAHTGGGLRGSSGWNHGMD